MFTGCGTALVTPFRRDLSLDEPTLRKLVRRQIDAGINFLVPCGTTGENPTLSRAEHLRIVEITLEEAKGKIPVLAGAGGYNTQEVIELAREVEHLGEGLLVGVVHAGRWSHSGSEEAAAHLGGETVGDGPEAGRDLANPGHVLVIEDGEREI